ncbi:MAG: amidohydrolase [Haliangiales bacterium]
MTLLPIVDAHMHMWDYENHKYPWLQGTYREFWFGDYRKLRKNYLLANYLADVRSQNVVKCVHLQAQWDHSDPIGETTWLQGIADEHGYPHGIIGFCDFRQDDADQVLAAHAEYRNVRGIRQDINWHPDPFYRFCEDKDLMTDPKWLRNFALLEKYGFSFDLQIYAGHQGEDAYQLVKNHPNIQFLLDHSGSPEDKSPEGKQRWRSALSKLAELPNVAAKLSGFDMHDHNWTLQSLREPIMDVIERFGSSRCLFASNFPVSSLYGSYDHLVSAHREILADLSADEQRAVLHDNAVRLYRL